ncbi:ENTH/VHS domain-containing protein [Cavenderia fasciculata]|uniref:ENTH/VHS domain-containing protein n=1 Tax=Cavenderia fasciculata TaxID=261658 RepID=F4Q7S5_CACFS|nr:ENTH/VHS domain-containing protein [Cavenderia fasciculata]EGG15825.1 ENTH/VHS domain-containing protein [Cavenderia fasciculata]|eukprot:XP_004352150.1 ENTH/VHS domain-containing protein [Cavenderia fasciculata]
MYRFSVLVLFFCLVSVFSTVYSTPVVPYGGYPLYKQCDSRWANNEMIGTTICQVGCLMSSISMSLAGKGVLIDGQLSTPASLNQWLLGNQGYNSNSDLIESQIPLISPLNVDWVGPLYNGTDFTMSEVATMLAEQDIIVILNVDNGGHFVLATGTDSDPSLATTIYVNDPGFQRVSYDYTQVVGYRNESKIEFCIREYDRNMDQIDIIYLFIWMDINVRRNIADLINDATKTGSLDLSKEHATAIKLLVKPSNLFVKCAYDLLIEKLKYKHCQVRLSSLNMINELFLRSKYFRELICNELSMVFEYAIGTDATKHLPPPAQTAIYMKQKALEYVEKWNESFGEHYSHLRVGYNYLKNSLKLKFPERIETLNQREIQEQERKRKTQQLLKIKYNQLVQEFQPVLKKLQDLLDQIEKSLTSIIPSTNNFDDLFDNQEEEKEEDDDDLDETEMTSTTSTTSTTNNNNNNNNRHEDINDILRQGGFGSTSYSIEVTLDTNEVNDIVNNQEIDLNLKEKIGKDLAEVDKQQNLIINDWYNTLIKYDVPREETQAYRNYLRRVIDIQANINNIQSRCNDMKITPIYPDPPRKEKENDDGEMYDDDGNLIEMEMYQPGDNNQEEQDEEEESLVEYQNESNTSFDSTSSPMKYHKHYYGVDIEPPKLEDLPDGETIDDLYARAPVVQTHPMLMHWGKKEVSLHKGLEIEHRFLGESNIEPTISIQHFSSLNQMSTVYEPPTQIHRQCKHQLAKGGGLCPRRDLRICPFHGLIVDRDDEGYPTEEFVQDPDWLKMIELEKEEKKKRKMRKERVIKSNSNNLVNINLDPVQDRIGQVFKNKKMKK